MLHITLLLISDPDSILPKCVLEESLWDGVW